MYIGIILLPLIGSILSVILGSRRGSEIVLQVGGLVSVICAVIGVYETKVRGNEVLINISEWIGHSMLDGGIGLRIDGVSMLMASLITGVSLLVLIYSSEYMSGDKGYVRYITYIGIFTSCMLVLVMADNLLLTFLGWEGVGIVSYLLVSYWGGSIDGNKSAIQAVMVNRVGDISMLIGIILMYSLYGSVRYDVILGMSLEDGLILSGLLLIIGSMSKSAQVGLHLWLPNAMAAPTPISALLHAATMVTAGVYLMIRIFKLIEMTEVLLDVLLMVGGMSIIITGSIGLVVHDIKRVIAYSTGGQLGYMILGCGLCVPEVSLFHLLNHGFFKALLFLSAGIVIHGLRDEQDLRRLGGLSRLMPLAYTGFIIGSIALLGLPYLSGYYSKDLLLEVAYGEEGILVYGLALVGAFLTAAYSTRLIIGIFLVDSKGIRGVIETGEECGWRMASPVVLLSLLTISSGYLLKELMVGIGGNGRVVESEFIEVAIKLLPALVSLLGVGMAYFLQTEAVLYACKRRLRGMYRLLTLRWLFDKVVNELIVQEVMRLGYSGTYKIVDKGLLEMMGPRGVNEGFLMPLGKVQSNLQTGNLYNYILLVIIIIGIAVN